MTSEARHKKVESYRNAHTQLVEALDQFPRILSK